MNENDYPSLLYKETPVKQTHEQLARTLDAHAVSVPVGSCWLHKAGGRYVVTGFSIDTDNGSVRVQYRCFAGPNFDLDHSDGVTFSRPYDQWTADWFIKMN